VVDSISLSIGVMAPPALELFDALRNRLMRSVVWRQRLPVLGDAAGLTAESASQAYERIAADLAVDLQREFTSKRFIAEFLDSAASRRVGRGNQAAATPSADRRITAPVGE
jgi:hypothetical protein